MKYRFEAGFRETKTRDDSYRLLFVLSSRRERLLFQLHRTVEDDKLTGHENGSQSSAAADLQRRTSIKQGSALRPMQVALNGADGLDYLSGVNCVYIYLMEKWFLGTPRGVVTMSRRREIVKKLQDLHQWLVR